MAGVIMTHRHDYSYLEHGSVAVVMHYMHAVL